MLQHLQLLDDPSVTIDLVRAGIVCGGGIDLECATVLLPQLATLVSSSYEDTAIDAMQALAQLSNTFGPLIKSTRAAAKNVLGGERTSQHLPSPSTV